MMDGGWAYLTVYALLCLAACTLPTSLAVLLGVSLRLVSAGKLRERSLSALPTGIKAALLLGGIGLIGSASLLAIGLPAIYRDLLR
jgi:hypothetical protein